MIARGFLLSALAISALLLPTGCSTAYTGQPWDGPKGEASNRGPTFLGYSASPLYTRDVRTVAIEIFGSREFRRFWEFRVTEAVAKQLELRTGYRIVEASKADTILTGEVLGIPGATLAEQPDTAAVVEQQFGINIKWQWKDQRTGRILATKTTNIAYATLFPLYNETTFIAIDAAVDGVARKVVDGMRTDF